MASRQLRTEFGGSLIEMLIAVTIMSFVSSAILALMATNTKTNVKVQNQVDTLNASKIVIERVGKDVREARSLGDVFGDNFTDALSGLTMVSGANYFPSSNNPVYGMGEQPPKGWPASWPTDAAPGVGRYILKNDTLIVQVPVFDANGFPTMIPPNQFGVNRPKTPQVNVETHVYKILPDPDATNHPGEFIMQYVSFPGMAVNGVYDPNSASANAGPVTTLTGILGPLDKFTGQPRIFQFIDKTDANGVAQNAVNSQRAANYTGVIVNLEVRKHLDGMAARQNQYTSSMGFKTEVFMRNNALATTTGQPATP